MVHTIINALFKLFNKIKKKYELICRSHYWRNQFHQFIDLKSHMTEVQRKEVLDFYKPYSKINLTFHEFYLQKTKKFSVKYIPDDLYYTRIDPFFNNWDEARFLDNKCYYDRIFLNVKQPKTIVKRINEIWFDSSESIISIERVKNLLLEYNGYFLKKATESEGRSWCILY